MATSIGKLAYLITADASGFKQGMVATRTELSLSRKLFADSRTETEKHGMAIDRVTHLYRKGAIDLETYNRSLKQLQATQSTMSRMGGFLGGMSAGSVAGAFGIAVGIQGVANVMRDTISVSMDFEKSMSRVSALLQVGSGATDAQVDSLGNLARQLGAETVFTARDAAEAMQFFALAGFNVEKISKSMRPTLQLAAAGQMSIAESANIAAQVMSGMGIQADDLGFTVDVLTNAMTSANTDLVQLGDAMRFVGPIAKASGKDITETVAAIQMLSNAGLQGEMAGTALRGILMKLANPTNEATGALEDLGVEVLDMNGDMRHLADIIDDLNAEFDRLGLGTGERLQRISQIFEARAATGFVALMEQGGDQMRKFIDNLDRVGTSAAVADQQMDNLAGSVEELKGAWEEFQIALGSNNGMLRDLVDTATQGVRGMGGMARGEGGGFMDFMDAVTFKNMRDKAIAGMFGVDFKPLDRNLILDKPAGGDGADAADGMAGLTKEQRELIASGNTLLDTLFKEQEHFGKTSAEIELMRLKTEGLGDVSDDLVGSIERQIAAVDELKEAKKRQAEEEREFAAAMALSDSLNKRRAILEGFTEDEMKISEWFGRDIIDDDTAQSMRMQLRENEELERRNKERKELEKEAARISDNIRTPGEVLGREFFDIQQALDAGLITNEEANLASDKATKEMAREFRTKTPSRTAGAALERGSAEAFSAIMRAADRGKNKLEDLPPIAKEHLRVAQETLEALKAGAGQVQVVENNF